MKRWIVQPGGRSMWTAPDWVLGRGRAPPSSAKYRTTSAGDGRRTPEWPVLIRVIHHWRRRRRCRNPPCLTGTVWPSSSAPAHCDCMGSIGKKAISTFGLIPIYPMRTGKRLSMMPLVLSRDHGSEANQTVRVVCVHQLESPVRHRWS